MEPAPASGRPVIVRLPVSCTLTNQEGPERVARWRALDALVLGRVRGAGRLSVRYRRTGRAAAELTELVAAERECCAFLNWTLVEPQTGGDELELLVTGVDADLDILVTLGG